MAPCSIHMSYCTLLVFFLFTLNLPDSVWLSTHSSRTLTIALWGRKLERWGKYAGEDEGWSWYRYHWTHCRCLPLLRQHDVATMTRWPPPWCWAIMLCFYLTLCPDAHSSGPPLLLQSTELFLPLAAFVEVIFSVYASPMAHIRFWDLMANTDFNHKTSTRSVPNMFITTNPV